MAAKLRYSGGLNNLEKSSFSRLSIIFALDGKCPVILTTSNIYNKLDCACYAKGGPRTPNHLNKF